MINIISQLENVKHGGQYYRAACPICSSDGKTDRNLSIRIDNGACKCHRCGAKTKEIRKALGGTPVRHHMPPPVPLTPNTPTAWNSKRDRYAIAQYEFETIEGIRVQHVKFPKSDKYGNYSWRHFKHGTWYKTMGGYTPYLFNRADVERASIIFLVEGEKDAGRGQSEFRRAGYGQEFAFTTSHAGAGGAINLLKRINQLSEQIEGAADHKIDELVAYKYQLLHELHLARDRATPLKPHHIQQLQNKIVYLIGDNDLAGKEGVQTKYNQLIREGIDVHIIKLPVTEKGADLSDAFDADYTVHDLLAAAHLINRPEIAPLSLFTDLPHTCGKINNAFTALIHSDYTQIAAWKPHKWRICAACFDERVTRFAMQIESQQKKHALYHSQWTNTEWRRKRDAWRKRSKRKSAEIAYQSFPQEDGTLIVVHNIASDADEAIPTNRLELKVLLNVWAMTPIGKAVGNSRNDFGGEYRGTKGNQSDKARAEREAERQKLFELVSTTLNNFVPDPEQRTVIDMSAKSIAALLPLTSNKEVLSWLYYEYYAGKKRVTVLKRILNHLHAIKPEHNLSIQIFGFGRNEVAAALECELNPEGAGTIKIDPFTAAQQIAESATSHFVRGGGSLINRTMSAFLDTAQTPENSILEDGQPQLIQELAFVAQ